jgi:competence protein ComEA
MATADDRHGALLLLLLALAGAIVRIIGLDSGAPGELGYRPGGEERPQRDSVAVSAERLQRPLAAGERVDVDVVGADELTRLPRIGPALAARIVEDRRVHGAFGSLERLSRVSGIGRAVLEAVTPYARFSGRVGPPGGPRGAKTKVSLNTASAVVLEQLPGVGPARARAIIEDRRRNGRYQVIEDLARVQGIGPATIERLRSVATVR